MNLRNMRMLSGSTHVLVPVAQVRGWKTFLDFPKWQEQILIAVKKSLPYEIIAAVLAMIALNYFGFCLLSTSQSCPVQD